MLAVVSCINLTSIRFASEDYPSIDCLMFIIMRSFIGKNDEQRVMILVLNFSFAGPNVSVEYFHLR